MLIAITATENSLQAEIDPRFGRAAYYMIINTITGETMPHDNSDGINASNGAGTGAAQTLSEYGVEALYTGRVGPKAAEVLDKAGIPYYENISGTVQQLLDRLKNGEAMQTNPTPTATAPPVRDTDPVSAQTCPGALLGSTERGAGRGQGMGRGMGQGRGAGRRQATGRGMGRGCRF